MGAVGDTVGGGAVGLLGLGAVGVVEVAADHLADLGLELGLALGLGKEPGLGHVVAHTVGEEDDDVGSGVRGDSLALLRLEVAESARERRAGRATDKETLVADDALDGGKRLVVASLEPRVDEGRVGVENLGEEVLQLSIPFRGRRRPLALTYPIPSTS